LADDPRSQQAFTNESLNFLFFSSCGAAVGTAWT